MIEVTTLGDEQPRYLLAGLGVPLDARAIKRLAQSYREKPMGAYTCQSCGAPVRTYEPACSYCTTERPTA